MKVPGSIYVGKKIYLALYNFWPDIYRKAPIKAIKAEHIAHVSYTTGKVKRGIDIFIIDKYPVSVDIKRTIKIKGDEVNEKIDRDYSIKYEIMQELGTLEQEILKALRQDIKDFCKEKKAKKQDRDIRKRYVKKIFPKTAIRKIKPKQYLLSGKRDFVPACALQANLDFSFGCISGFIPEKDSYFDGKFFHGFFLDPFAECQYCYSIYQHKSFAKYIIEIDKKQLKDELINGNFVGADGKLRKGKIKVLRLGKSTEAGSSYTLELLVQVLETCLETGTRVVMPTKYLAFNREIAQLLKKTRSSVLYSLGWDDLERGACLHNCNNKFRLEQALLYRKAGVNSVIYLHIDLPHEPDKRTLEVINFAKKHNIPIQFLPIRIPTKEIVKKITGLSWNELLMQNQLSFFSTAGGYYRNGGTLIAQAKHPFYLNLIKDNKGNYRLCHHDKKETYCGKCFLAPGFIIPTEEVRIEYKKAKRRKKKVKYDLPLFEK